MTSILFPFAFSFVIELYLKQTAMKLTNLSRFAPYSIIACPVVTRYLISFRYHHHRIEPRRIGMICHFIRQSIALSIYPSIYLDNMHTRTKQGPSRATSVIFSVPHVLLERQVVWATVPAS